MTKIPVVGQTLLLIQAGFLVAFYFGGQIPASLTKSSFLASLVLTACSLTLLGYCVALLTPSGRFWNVSIPISFLLLYTAAGFYHLRATTSFDASLLLFGTPLLGYPESYSVILSAIEPTDWLILGILALVLVVLAFRAQVVFSAKVEKRWRRLAFVLPLYLGLSFLPITTWDECNAFLKSIYQIAFSRSPEKVLPPNLEKYPYVRVSRAGLPHVSSPERRPHVFLILVESFNRNYVEARSPQGQEYTPFLNRLIPQGLYVERFYGNSVYTAQGQAVTLCSILPLKRSDIVIRDQMLEMKALPKVLGEHGYRTLYFQGQSGLEFHNTGRFMTRIGFDEVKAMNQEFVGPEDREFQWGWGLQDDVFYKKFFKWLDNDHRVLKRKQEGPPVRYFVTLMTISNHAPFNEIPVSERRLYPDPKNRLERYANTVRATDKYLETFFAELKKRDHLTNSLVFILGDHGYPQGEHRHSNVEVKYYEESFRTPFLMVGSRPYEGKRLRSPCYSQLDVAPTILDMLDIETPNHFLGRSMVDPRNREETIQRLVQPFDGCYLSTVKFPYKYVKHLRSGKEFLHHLERDPSESVNLLPQEAEPSVVAELRQGLDAIYLNETLIHENRIWPKEF